MIQKRIKSEKYYNRPQLKAMLVNGWITVIICGRALGKTIGMMAPRVDHLVKSMPRSTINIYTSTYRQFMVTTGKELFYGLNQLGYKEFNTKTGHGHYVYRKPPPDHWPKPYRNPLDPQFSIYLYNGTILQLISEDVFQNGGSAQAMLGDESRKFDPHKYGEVSLAMRDDSNFPDNPDFMSEWLFSDQPQSPKEAWLFNYEKNMDPGQIELIMETRMILDGLRLELFEEKEEKAKAYLEKKIRKWESIYNQLRFNSTYFLEASTIENVWALGTQFIDKQKKALTDSHFRRAILNHRLKSSDRLFFPSFDRHKNCYNDFNYSYLDSLGLVLPDGMELNQKQDADILPFEKFIGSIDTGGTFNGLVICQIHPEKVRLPNIFYVEPPGTPKDLAKKFAKYYEHHLKREFHFIYDQTQNQDGFMHIKAYKEFADSLRSCGWEVYEDYRPVVPSYENRYIFFNKLFAGEYKGIIPDVELNKTHCENLIIGLETAEIYPGTKDPYKLDKRPEKDKKMDQTKTTHFPEAMACLLYNLLADKVDSSGFATSLSK